MCVNGALSHLMPESLNDLMNRHLLGVREWVTASIHLPPTQLPHHPAGRRMSRQPSGELNFDILKFITKTQINGF